MTPSLYIKPALGSLAFMATGGAIEVRMRTGHRSLSPSHESRKVKRWLISVGLVSGLFAGPQTLLAQESPHSGSGMTSVLVPAKAGCPAFAWNTVRTPAAGGTANISGIVWLVDGTGFSSVRGLQSADGAFESKVTRVSGNGLSGSVTGQRHADGSMDFKMVGEGCSNVSVHAAPGQTTSSE